MERNGVQLFLDLLFNYVRNNHCDMTKTPGVDFTTGSLGQGLSVAAGICLARRMQQIDTYTYLILGDGEIQEGQIWEAAMFASHCKLDNLIAFLDCNRMQFDGETREIMNVEDLEEKWNSFGWHVQRIDGHSFPELSDAVLHAKGVSGAPSMIICNTVKAKGFLFGEGKVCSHNMDISQQQVQEALRALDDGDGEQ